MEKDFKSSYIGPREDIVRLVPGHVKKVLDVGCSIGRLAEDINQKNGAEVTGIELDEEMANIARKKLDRTIVGNIEELDLSDSLTPGYFDCVIFADILEHLKNPCKILAECVHYLEDNGIVIASIPNIRHFSIIFELVFKGRWRYRERGILDFTHLRFFTLKSIREMFRAARLEIINVDRNYRIIERPHRYNKFSKYFAVPGLRDFLAFQYLITARKSFGNEL